ncbi:GAF domain-containing protein [Sphaerisporangium fuscum]|uniref:GAF domain-containing protein n=1 Tax=Sphaerisporangium fuscum TaxID=2835868 RepID=UPI001BDCFDAB|nr:GAF domain-containing protein [Sphaerisporangium fuscum]
MSTPVPADVPSIVPADPTTAGIGDAGRLAAVRRYEILDAPRDGSFDEIAELAALVCGTPIATVTIVDEDRVWFAAAEGLEGVTQVGTEPGLCASAVLAEGPYIVEDAEVDPRTLDHPLVRGELGLRFYAAAPIITADGYRLGTVNVIDQSPRQISETQHAVLSKLAALVARHLELRLDAIKAVRAERSLRKEADERAAAATEMAARLREAAAVQRDVDHPKICQLGGAEEHCDKPAELKIADSWGDSAWGCFPHAEEALILVKGVFIATEEEMGGLAAYMKRRRPA